MHLARCGAEDPALFASGKNCKTAHACIDHLVKGDRGQN